MPWRLRIANVVFHGLHVAIILFLALGWIFPSTRALHLAFILFTLTLWLAFGYCPLTRWHWKVRKAMGLPGAKGPYIPFLAAQVAGRPVNAAKLDRVVILVTVGIALLSVLMNCLGGKTA